MESNSNAPNQRDPAAVEANTGSGGGHGNNHDGINGNGHNDSHKRAAYAGQWRTPPLPIFAANNPVSSQCAAAGGSHQSPAPVMSAGVGVPSHIEPRPPSFAEDSNTTTGSSNNSGPTAALVPGVSLSCDPRLPVSTEDYVKALQEAYRRGAEAAAALAKQQHQQHQQQQPLPVPPPSGALQPSIHLSSVVSCPDFQTNMGGGMMPPKSNDALPVPGATTEVASAPILPMPVAVPNPLSGGHAASTATATGPVHAHHAAHIPSASMPPPPPPVVQAPSHAVHHLHPHQQPQQQQQQQHHHQQQSLQHHHQQRSLSLPEMSSYAGQQQEEAKRQKRLARNRASARLRRLRKKNLVDAYETEVGLLERTLQKLKLHEWGKATTDANAMALVEALSMDRGQQELSADERKQAAVDILQQQLQFCQQLEELMQEQYALIQVAENAGAHGGEFQQLADLLQLSSEQQQRLRETASGWQEEWTALQTVKESLQAMKDNDWLWNQGVNAMAEQFLSILHKNQISKFMLWADHNCEAIEEMDGVNAPPGPPSGPVFQFGVDSTPEAIAADQEPTLGGY